MAFSLKLEPQGQYVELVLEGEFQLSEVIDVRQQVSRLCRLERITKLLVDARQAQPHFTALDLYTLASDLAGREAVPGMYYAVIVGQDSPQIDLFEQIARRRGVHVEHFTAQIEAVCRLLTSQPT
jgi:hypothetical protein